MKNLSQQRAVGAPQNRNTSSTMPGSERASLKAINGTSENARAVIVPQSKGMAKPPTANGAASGDEPRKFGRQLSTNNGEASGNTMTLQIMPDYKAKPNVSISYECVESLASLSDFAKLLSIHGIIWSPLFRIL